ALGRGGDNVQVDDERNGTYVTGQAAPGNVERVLHVALPPREVAAALLADTPLIAHEKAQVRWNTDPGRWVLTLALVGGGEQLLELTPQGYNVARSELRDGAGKKVWWIEHDD